MDNKVRNMINKLRSVKRSELKNNTQRVLHFLLTSPVRSSNGWVARTTLRIPSATARARDLRKSQYGGFNVECARAEDLRRRNRSTMTKRQTFYRVNPNSVTVSALQRVFKGVI